MSLTSTLRGWARRYGAEAAFVGRVAVAAFLPPGVNKLVEAGLEAAFEYIQSQPERSFDADGEEGLRQRLASVGVDETKLSQLSEQDQFKVQVMIRKSLITKIGMNDPSVVANEKIKYNLGS